MAHLDTAYKIGALQAQVDFEGEVNKLAAPVPAPTAPAPPVSALTAPRRQPGTFPIPEAPRTAPGQGTGVNPTLGAPNAQVRSIQ